jgi:hypothetical protein
MDSRVENISQCFSQSLSSLHVKATLIVFLQPTAGLAPLWFTRSHLSRLLTALQCNLTYFSTWPISADKYRGWLLGSSPNAACFSMLALGRPYLCVFRILLLGRKCFLIWAINSLLLWGEVIFMPITESRYMLCWVHTLRLGTRCVGVVFWD